METTTMSKNTIDNSFVVVELNKILKNKENLSIEAKKIIPKGSNFCIEKELSFGGWWGLTFKSHINKHYKSFSTATLSVQEYLTIDPDSIVNQDKLAFTQEQMDVFSNYFD